MKPEDMTREQLLGAVRNLQQLVGEALEVGRKEGAAVAFGLMGMAEVIRAHQHAKYWGLLEEQRLWRGSSPRAKDTESE